MSKKVCEYERIRVNELFIYTHILIYSFTHILVYWRLAVWISVSRTREKEKLQGSKSS